MALHRIGGRQRDDVKPGRSMTVPVVLGSSMSDFWSGPSIEMSLLIDNFTVTTAMLAFRQDVATGIRRGVGPARDTPSIRQSTASVWTKST